MSPRREDARVSLEWERGKRPPCPAAAPSRALEGHTHSCSGAHLDDELHMCSDPKCRRWFGLPSRGRIIAGWSK